jgi:hypothetical protein
MQRIVPAKTRAAELAVGPDGVLTATHPTMAAEDLAHHLEQAPGCFGSIGVGTPGATSGGGAHSGAFRIDEAALPRRGRVLPRAGHNSDKLCA